MPDPSRISRPVRNGTATAIGSIRARKARASGDSWKGSSQPSEARVINPAAVAALSASAVWTATAV